MFMSTPASGSMLSSNPEYTLSSIVPMLPPNTHCLQLFQCFHQQQIQLVKVSVNREEDMGVDASVMRYVQQVLIQYDDSEAR